MSLLALLQPTAAAPTVEPLRWDGTQDIHVHIDGNSIFAQWVYAGLDLLSPLASLWAASGATHSNSAIAGQSWRDMDLNPADVDGAYQAGMINILVIAETTNSVFNEGKTAAQVQADLAAYVLHRRARNRWDRIICVGSIPRGGRPEDAADNAVLLAVDAWVAANATDLGIHAVVSLRAAAPEWFGGDGTSFTGFMASSATCLEAPGGQLYGDGGPRIHPLGAARDAIAQAIRDTLEAL